MEAAFDWAPSLRIEAPARHRAQPGRNDAAFGRPSQAPHAGAQRQCGGCHGAAIRFLLAREPMARGAHSIPHAHGAVFPLQPGPAI